MHTVKVLAAGFALLAVCLLVGRGFGTGPVSSGLALGAKIFLPLWFVASAINMWIGVTKAGYSVADEAKVFILVFGVPAAVALLVWWRFARG